MPRNLTGIRRIGGSYEVYGRVGSKQFSRRFPLDTPLAVMRQWREEQFRQRKDALPQTQAGTVGELVERFLALETGRRRQDFEDLLGHWIDALRDKPRVLLTPALIQATLDTWRTQGVAASTLNHRRQALRTLFARLEPDLRNPVAQTKPYRQPEPEPRAIPEDVLDQVFAQIPDCATKARLLVICHTGVRHSELMRVRPEDVVLDGERAHVYVRSGKGGRHRLVPLHGRGQGAFAALALYEAWGPFSASSVYKTWALACRKAGLEPRRYRPYDLRHRFATRLREHGADLADVQELLGHRDIRTTRRYAPVVHAKLVSVVQALVPEDAPLAGAPAGAEH